MRSIGKSNIGALVSYLSNPQNKQERVGTVTVTNCVQDNALDAVFEIQAVQALNTRTVSDKTYHLIVSFRPGENPDKESLKFIESQICKNLGFEEHQRISAVHHDTDNVHIHIAINKIHPTNHTAHTPYFDYATLAKVCERLEKDLGLQVDNHVPRLTCSQGRANDMERHAGVESLLNWIQRECAEEIQQAKIWKDLHAVLQDHGLQLREKGNGFVIIDDQGQGVKASSVSRLCSKSNLEKRLGIFTLPTPPTSKKSATQIKSQKPKLKKIGVKPPPRSQGSTPHLSSLGQVKIENRSTYKQQPVFSRRIDTTELYAEYLREQKSLDLSRRKIAVDLRIKKDGEISKARQKAKIKRAAIKLLNGPGVNKKLLYSLASGVLQSEISKIKSGYRETRDKALGACSRKAWADWLQVQAAEGRQDALQALQAREKRFRTKGGDSVKGDRVRKDGRIPGLKHDNITKAGTIIYRVGSTAIRDDGTSFAVTRGASDGGAEAILRMAVYRYGSRIKVTGSAEFKEKIVQVAVKAKIKVTFENEDLEKKRLDLKAAEEAHKNLSSVKMREKVGLSKQQAKAAGAFVEEALGELDVFINHQKEEHNNEQRRRYNQHGRGRRPNRRSPGEATGERDRLGGYQSEGNQSRGRGWVRKPNVGCVGTSPPPTSRNRLRKLSSLGLVQFSDRSEVLLPGDVSNHLEHSRTQHTDQLRRPISGSGRIAAVDKYIEEREGKRLKGIDIPKHRGYIESDQGVFVYAGIRYNDGGSLALLKNDKNEIVVLSINASTVNRLKKCKVGDNITLTAGQIKTRGRSL